MAHRISQIQGHCPQDKAKSMSHGFCYTYIVTWTIVYQYNVGFGIAYPWTIGNARASVCGMSDSWIPAFSFCIYHYDNKQFYICLFRNSVGYFKGCARHVFREKNMKKLVFSTVIMLLTAFSVNAQQKTEAELKVEREQIASELNSKDVIKRQEKLQKLNEKAVKVKKTDLGSIDGLLETSTAVLGTVMSANDLLKKYGTEIKDNGNGDIEITKYEAGLEDYKKLGEDLAKAALLAADGVKRLESAQDDAKKLSPLKAKDALSSVSYSVDVLKLSAEEIELQTRIVTNLIESIKASKNL